MEQVIQTYYGLRQNLFDAYNLSPAGNGPDMDLLPEGLYLALLEYFEPDGDDIEDK